MNNEIRKTDKRYRRNLFLAYILIIISITCFIKFALPLILNSLASIALPKSFIIVEIMLIIFILLFIFPALYLIKIGKEIITHDSFPFPGMKVIRDTKVLHGNKAVFRGKALVILGKIAIIIAILGSLMTHIVFKRFKNDPLFKPIFQRPVINNVQDRI